MKNFSRVIVFMIISSLVIACGQLAATIPSQIPPPSATATITLIPSQATTASIEPTATRVYVQPTLLPTIDPTLVPNLLSNAFTLREVSGSLAPMRRISGWEYGFRQNPCYGYQWLDSNHLLLYPRTGEGMEPFMDGSRREDLSSELITINLTNGNFWLLPSQPHKTLWEFGPDCNSVYWSQELGVIISQENSEATDNSPKASVSIHTFNGEEIARYGGEISGVSPNGTKVMVDDNAIIDLRKNKITNLAWHVKDDPSISSKLYWSSDETRVYRCCFYFADLKTGKSYNFDWSDLRGPDGKPLPNPMISPHTNGQWVRNDTYFFPTWNYMSDGGYPRIIFSPVAKKYYFINLPSTPPINPETMTYKFSPDGIYVWITGFNYGDGLTHGFLINLTTLEITSYDISVNDFVWSPDGQFAWMNSLDNNRLEVLSVSTKQLKPILDNPLYETLSWHPTDHTLAYLTEEKQALILLDTKTMSYQKRGLPTTYRDIVWSPNGKLLALISEDSRVWMTDYQNLEKLKQLTPPLYKINSVQWSPDSTSISFISGKDIYVVTTTK